VTPPTESLRLLISGGSRGLGLALCEHHVARGNSVVTFARSSTPELAALAAASSGRLHFLTLDLLDANAPRDASVGALSALGGIDVLINNVAIGQDSLLAHLPDSEIERIVLLNVVRTLQLTRYTVRAMIAADAGGTIVNISSICASQGYSGLTAYAASKGGVEAFTRSAARELGGHGIFVNCVAPGFFKSDMSDLLADADIARIRRRTPSRQLASIEQIVRASDTLVAARALNITGQILRVDGGATA
jgi:3-oxoacyl-[acyl-carrier protein] reductase